MENREMFDELNALVGAMAKALEISEEEVVKAVEANQVTITLGEDEEGRRFINVAHEGRNAQIYPGAIKHTPEGAEEQEPAQGGGCGTGGCGCHG